MTIVSRGLGQPESGAIVAGGLGVAETDPNAMSAALSGSGSLTATLTAVRVGGGHSPVTLTARKPRRRVAFISADLSGSSMVAASPSWTWSPTDDQIRRLVEDELLLLDAL